jgi:hypothetical protein
MSSTAPIHGVDPAARRTATVILEVLGGLRTATAASEVLSLPLARYYVLERRAVLGMVQALGPRPRGRPRSDEERMRQLTAEVERLRAEVTRVESLYRITQRAIGVPSELARPGATATRGRSQGRSKPRVKRILARLRTPEPQDVVPRTAVRTESASPRGVSDG